MWKWKLTGVTFKIMILCDERGACGSSVCENVGVWTSPQSDTISMFGIIAFTTEEVYPSRRKVLIHEKPPA